MFKRNLSKRIVALFLIIGLLPLGILAVLFYIQMKSSLQKTVGNNLIALASEVGTEIDRTIFVAYTNVKTLSNNPVIESTQATKEEKLEEMRKIQDFYRIFEDITLLDLQGNVLTSTTYSYRGAWKTKKWYLQAVEGMSVVSNAHVLLSPYKIVLVTIAPVRDADGNVIAVVAGQINMEKIWEITDKVKLGKTGFIVLVNEYGELIACPDKKKLFDKIEPPSLKDKFLSEPSGFVEYKAKERYSGEQVCGFVLLRGYEDYKGMGWRVGLTQSAKEAYAVIRTTQSTVLSTALGFFLFIILVSIHLAREIVRPVKALLVGTKRVAEGDLTSQIKILSEDEIGKLAVAFNQMTGDLKKSMEEIKDYSRTLEEKVEERTKELKSAHEQLVQTAKMAAVGQLSAGVAHEINNPLGGILGYAQFSLRKIEKPDFNIEDFKICREYLKHIERESQRCKNIVDNLLTFSRKSSEVLQPVDIKKIIEDTLLISMHSLKIQNINVSKEYSLDIPLINGNPNQLQQVFTNIIINAQHAMLDGGQLNIGVKVVQKGKNKNVQISFQDTGYGISKENLARIFEPFFTTKEDWKSVGLGLSICYQIIQQHKGEIIIESELSKGTIVTVSLPCNN